MGRFIWHALFNLNTGECYEPGKETPSTEYYNAEFELQCTCENGGWTCNSAQKRVS